MMADNEYLQLAKSRCVDCGDLKTRHEDLGKKPCTVCSCKSFRPGSTVEDGQKIALTMRRWTSPQ